MSPTIDIGLTAMKPLFYFHFVFLTFSFGAVSLGQEQQPTTDKPAEKIGPDNLPEPMETVPTNLRDLERSGHFTITKRAYRAFGLDAEDAMVWTIITNRPLTYRLARRELAKVRDVRLYKRGELAPQEIHSTVLFYSPRIDFGAIHGKLISIDEEFEIWFFLDRDKVRYFQKLDMDTVQFGPRKKRMGR